MPTYEYKCSRCGRTFEIRQRFADEPLKTHEDCGGEVERLISAPALQFKGKGWYVTDYGKGGSSPAPSNGHSESKSEGKSENKSEGKSEGKKESKTESTPTAATKP